MSFPCFEGGRPSEYIVVHLFVLHVAVVFRSFLLPLPSSRSAVSCFLLFRVSTQKYKSSVYRLAFIAISLVSMFCFNCTSVRISSFQFAPVYAELDEATATRKDIHLSFSVQTTPRQRPDNAQTRSLSNKNPRITDER